MTKSYIAWLSANKEAIDKCVWRPIQEFPKYEVGSNGYVRRADTLKILKNNPDKNGYLCVNLYSDDWKIKRQGKIHRLVAIAFIENPNNYLVVHHINEIKTDNNPNNLKWVDISSHGKHHGYDAYLKVRDKFKEKSERGRKPVIMGDRHKNEVASFSSLSEAARYIIMELNLSTRIAAVVCHIGRSCQHKTRLAYGYKWKFKIKD